MLFSFFLLFWFLGFSLCVVVLGVAIVCVGDVVASAFMVLYLYVCVFHIIIRIAIIASLSMAMVLTWLCFFRQYLHNYQHCCYVWVALRFMLVAISSPGLGSFDRLRHYRCLLYP